MDEPSQKARMLFNGTASSTLEPEDDAERFALARTFIDEAGEIFGLHSGTLIDDRIKFLPLGMVGVADKGAIRFRQVVSAVPVEDGWVNLVFDDQDNLLCIDNQAFPAMDGFNVTPTVTSQEAATAAAAQFLADTGFAAGYVGDPRLTIARIYQGSVRVPRLVWRVETTGVDGDDNVFAFDYAIAAQIPAATLHKQDLVFNFSQQTQPAIQVYVRANVVNGAPDFLPYDAGAMNYAEQPIKYAAVRRVLPSGAKPLLGFTDASGFLLLPSTLNGKTIEVDYSGQYAAVCSMPYNERSICVDCEDSSFQHVLTPGVNNVTMNGGGEIQVAQASAYYYVNELGNWIRSVDPTDETFDDGGGPPGQQHVPFDLRPNYSGRVNPRPFCNFAQFQSVCAPVAQMSGRPMDLLMFTRIDPLRPCVNTAYSAVIWHEMGHWMNALYDNGNGVGSQPSFGESMGDTWSVYLMDQPNYPGPNHSYSGENTVPFCGDCPPAPSCSVCQDCRGGVDDRKILMGALWKVRRNLKADANIGDDLGRAVANSLFLGWMNAFDTNEVIRAIEYQWLVLASEQDGLLDNAPHKSHIVNAFEEQGFPVFQLPPIRYSCP
jgi:hypothetical protein